MRAGGILYISKQRTFGVRVPRNVLIFQDRMFVANDAELLPAWAEFVSGIIETTELTPNAARDGFIKNKAWSQLREALGHLIISSMDKLRETNRKQLSYILKYHDLGIKAACHHGCPQQWCFVPLENVARSAGSDDWRGGTSQAAAYLHHQ